MAYLRRYATSFSGRSFGWHMGAPEAGDRNLSLYAPAVPPVQAIDYLVSRTLAQQGPRCTAATGLYWNIALPVAGTWPDSMMNEIYRLEKLIDGDTLEGSTIHSLVKVLGAGTARVPGLNRIKSAAFAYDLKTGDNFMLSGQGGLMMGMAWFEGMLRVDKDGFVWPTGKEVGGHAIFLNGTNRVDKFRTGKQSWGLIPEFPNGEFKIADDAFDYLHRRGMEIAAAVEAPLSETPSLPVIPDTAGCMNAVTMFLAQWSKYQR